MIEVKLIAKDAKTGKLKLSRKALLPKPEGWVEREPRERKPRPEGDKGEKRGERGPRRDRH
jgi:polyribonucleotide nucleotidyltransferase